MSQSSGKDIKKYVQVMFELGHEARYRDEPTPEGYTHDWTLYVKGVRGAEIHHFVEKVIFHLHESFAKPKRVTKEPPYEVSESGYASFMIPVEIHYKREARVSRFEYDLVLMMEHHKPTTKTIRQGVIFKNPGEDFERLLLKGGADILKEDEVMKNKARPGSPPRLPSHDTSLPHAKEKTSSKKHHKGKQIPSPSSSTSSSTAGGAPQKQSSQEKSSMLSSPKHHDLNKKSSLSTSSSSITKNTSQQFKPKRSSTPSSANESLKKRKRSPSPGVSLSPFSSASSLSSPSSPSAAADAASQSVPTKSKPAKNEHSSKNKVKKSNADELKNKKIKVENEMEINKRSKQKVNGSSSEKPIAKLFKEMSDDDSASEDLPVLSKVKKEKAVKLIDKKKMKGKEGESGDVKAKLNGKSKESHNKSKDNKSNKESKQGNRVKSEESKSGGKKKKASAVVNGDGGVSSKSSSGKHRFGSSLSLVQEQRYYSELADLQKKLTECRDRDRLQRVVNIIADTGLFTITQTTLDFDLVKLDESVVKKLWECFE